MKQKLSREENRLAWLIAAAIVALLLAGALVGYWLTHRPKQTSDRVAIAAPGQALLQAAEGLDEIAVEVTFDPDADAHLTAVQTLAVTNRTGQEQATIVLRSYTGAYLREDTSPCASDELFDASYPGGFSPGGLIVDSAQLDGTDVAILWQDDAQTVLVLTPETPWLPGETRTVTLRWHAAVPELAGRFGRCDGIWALGNLFPTPAVWQGDAWDMRPVLAVGDPFRSDCANWRVTLTTPDGWQAAASAYAEPERPGKQLIYRYEALAMRDFTLVLSDRFRRAAATEGGTQVIAYALTEEDARTMALDACQALVCFAPLWGEYVYPTFTLAQISFPFGGMEYSGLVMIGDDAMHPGGMLLDLAIAHETAHQWWAIQVGSDSIEQAWMDESLAVYSQLRYLEHYYGRQVRDQYAAMTVEAAMRITIPGALTPGSPLDFFGTMRDYSIVVYERGAALWTALETLMGADTLDAALRDYQARFRFATASRPDLENLLSAHAGFDLSALLIDYLDTELIN